MARYKFNEREFVKNSEDFKQLDISLHGVEAYVNFKRLTAYFFTGKKGKADWSTRFKDKISILKFIDKKVKEVYDRNKAKELSKIEDKIKAKEVRSNIQVNDIFATHWGYENTYVEFFQVIGKPSPATVIVREIQKVTVKETSWCSADVKCIKDSFIGEPKKCQINKYGYIVKVDRYGNNASKTSEDATHYTSWGY